MNIRTAALAFAAYALASIAPSHAVEDIVFWKQVGNWTVNIDNTDGAGCFAVASFDGNADLRIQWSPVDQELYVVLLDSDWTSLQIDQVYDVSAVMDYNRAPWSLPATAIHFAGKPGLAMTATDDMFVDEFMRNTGLEFFLGDETIASLNITGSNYAYTELLNCQQEVERALSSP